MNARQQAEAARRLEAALAIAGLAVERPIGHGGNIGGYEPVPGSALMAPWLARTWRIRLIDAADVPVIDIGSRR